VSDVIAHTRRHILTQYYKKLAAAAATGTR